MRKVNLAACVVSLALMAFAAVAIAEDAPKPAAAVATKTLTLEGSTTVGPITDAFVAHFQKQYPDLKITAKNTGSGNGINALSAGTCDIATASRAMKPEEYKKAVENKVLPVAHAIAMDGICIAVNPANGVKSLTKAQLKDIYTGKITNWKQVDGPNLAIVVISRENSSGTFEAFNEMVLQKAEMAKEVQTVSSSKEVADKVEKTEGAIGYVGLAFLGAKVKGVQVEGVEPSKKTIVSGKYPLSRPLFLYTNGYPALGTLIYEYCTLYLSAAGQDMIEKAGFIPMTQY